MMVVYHHLDLQVGRGGGGPLPLAVLGASGVDVFFAISGFIIWVTTVRQQLAPLDFLYRRVARIVPLYWAVTLTVSAVALVAPSLFNTMGFDGHNLWRSLLFIPAWNRFVEEIAPVYIQGWTINYEMFFYLLLAGAIAAPRRLWLGLTLAGLMLFVTLGLSGAVSGSVALTFWTRPILVEFALGLLAGALYLESDATRAPMAALLAISAGALISSQWFGVGFPASGADYLRVLWWGLPAAGVVLSAAMLEKGGVRFRSGVFGALGDASYSIYMTHIAVLPITSRVWRQLGLAFTGLAGFAYVVAAMLAVSLAGYVVYRTFELPMMALTKRLRPRGWSRAARLTPAGAA